MECEFPQYNATSDDVQTILSTVKTIAILGLSPNPEKASYRVAAYLKAQGYQIVPIYPKEDEILGEKVYRSLKEVPFKIDMVDMFRKPEAAAGVLQAIKEVGNIDVFWMQLGIVNNEVAKEAEEMGLKVVQNKCTKIEHQNLQVDGQ